jgi:hypothetical protein
VLFIVASLTPLLVPIFTRKLCKQWMSMLPGWIDPALLDPDLHPFDSAFLTACSTLYCRSRRTGNRCHRTRSGRGNDNRKPACSKSASSGKRGRDHLRITSLQFMGARVECPGVPATADRISE